jgi:hypothetical protein
MIPAGITRLGQWWTCQRCENSHVEKDCCEQRAFSDGDH